MPNITDLMQYIKSVRFIVYYNAKIFLKIERYEKKWSVFEYFLCIDVWRRRNCNKEHILTWLSRRIQLWQVRSGNVDNVDLGKHTYFFPESLHPSFLSTVLSLFLHPPPPPPPPSSPSFTFFNPTHMYVVLNCAGIFVSKCTGVHEYISYVHTMLYYLLKCSSIHCWALVHDCILFSQ